MKKFKLISVALFSLFTLSTARQSVVSAEDKLTESTESVAEDVSDKKVEIDESLKEEADKATVVQGADGLMYVVVDENNPDKLLRADDPLEDLEKNTGAVEVGIDEARQKKADRADEEIKDFEDVDYNDVNSLQSALNNPKFPFVDEEKLSDLLSKTKDTYESEALVKKTRGYFGQRILELSNNLNDVPKNAKVSRSALVSARASRVSETRINPPAGYPWVMYLVRSNGYSYTENYAVRRTIDGKEAFCLQAGVTATNTYTGSTSGYLSSSQREVISSILTAYKEFGGWANNDAGKQRWIGAQRLVWSNSNEKPRSVSVTPNWRAGSDNWVNELSARANVIRIRPKWDATSKTANEGDKVTFKVTNSWGNHNLYVKSVSGGGKATFSGNTLTVDTNGATGTKMTIDMVKGTKPNETQATTVWSNGAYQKLVTGNFYVGTSVTVNVKRKGTVEVIKVDSDTKNALAGATFRFTYSGKSKDVTSGTNGRAKLTERLKAGTVVKVKEIKAPNGYQLDPTEFSMTVKENKNVTTTRNNKKSTGSVEIEKVGDLDGLPLPNVVFAIYGSDNKIVKDNLKTNASGKIRVDNLKFGKYYALEKQGVAGYAPDGVKYNFEINSATTSAKPAKVKVTNIYKVSVSEKVSDMNEKQVLKNTWSADSSDFLQYDILTGTLSKSGNNAVKSFVIEGNYDSKNVDLTKTEVFVGSSNVTSKFDISNDTGSGKALAKAKANTLTANDTYEKAYTLRLTMKIKKSTLENNQQKATLKIIKNSKVTVGSKISKSATSNNVETTLFSRKITINHIDEKDKSLLKQDTDYKYDGEKYEYEPRTDLLDKDGNRYKSEVIHTGKVDGKDITLTTPYHIPALTVNVDRIQIDTAKAEMIGHLPTEVTLSKKEEYPNELSKIVFKVKITDKNKNKVVYDKDFKYKDFESKIFLRLATDYLTKDQKVDYSVDVVLVENPDKNKFETETKDLKTVGYTATEKVLTNRDLQNEKVDYSAVVRTVKERINNKPIQEYKERISYKFTEKTRTKTGYGVSVDLEPTYMNEIGKEAKMTVYSYPNDDLVDSKIDEIYPSSNEKTEVKMDRMKNDSKVESDVLTQNLLFQFPHMNIERKTGNVYADSQKDYQSIKYELIDGNRKLYVPIWCDLGDYSIGIKSNTIGSNHISLDMNRTLDVYAYMYATIDSETSKEDELLLMPVYPDSAKPEGWNQNELNWLGK